GLLQPPAETAAAAQFYGPEHRTTVGAEFVRCFATPAINHFPVCHGLSGGRRMRSFGKLYIQLLIAIALAVVLGYVEPEIATALKPLGDAFIKAIRMMVAPIVFTTVVVGIATMGNIRRVASVGIKALIYFEIVSTLALILGIVVGNIWHFGAGMNID